MHRVAQLVTVFAAAVLALVATSKAQPSTVKPAPPLVVANGTSVTVSWRLPVFPRPLNVFVLRGESGGALFRIATVEAERRSYTDSSVTLGQTYDYAIVLDLRGQPP